MNRDASHVLCLAMAEAVRNQNFDIDTLAQVFGKIREMGLHASLLRSVELANVKHAESRIRIGRRRHYQTGASAASVFRCSSIREATS